MVKIHSNLRKISQNIKKHKNINLRTIRYKVKAVLLTFVISVIILVSHSGLGVGLAEFVNSTESVSATDRDVIKISILEMPRENAKVPPAHIGKAFTQQYIPFVMEEDCEGEESDFYSAKEEEELLTEADYEESLVLFNRSNVDSESEKEALLAVSPTPTPVVREGKPENKTEKTVEADKTEKTEKTKKTAAKASKSKLEQKYNAKMQLALSDNEMAVLLRIVEAEATGEDIYGRMLVANVVINRMHSKQFPDSIQSVVFQNGQFAPIRDGRYESVKVSKKTKEAVNRVLAGEDYSNGALYFFARSKTGKTKAKWFDSNLEKLFQYGGHEFYVEK